MTTAEELLSSRKWRLTHGLWMLWGWFPFALTAWIGYLTIGVKAKSWKWIVTAVAFFIFDVLWFWLMGGVGGQTNVNIAVWSSIFLWIGNAAALQPWINRKWLVWRAQNDKSLTTPWYATATATADGPTNLQADPQRVASLIDNAVANGSASSTLGTLPPAPILPADLPPAPGAHSAPSSGTAAVALDINTATQSEFAALPGFDAATAAQVVAARGQIGGFRDTAELVTRAGVKPHVLAGLQGQIAVIPAANSVAPPLATPDAPSRDSGRRLEF